MRLREIRIPGLMILILLLILGRSNGQDVQPSEYQIKAAFLFNFAKFVEWPATSFTDPAAPLIIGVLGENPFGDLLDGTVHGKSLNGHPLTVRELPSASEITNCHILFISTSEKKKLPDLLKTLRGTPVLTVSEMDGFTQTGGMINFVWENNKIRFQINDTVAKTAGLKIGSKLLSLGTRTGH